MSDRKHLIDSEDLSIALTGFTLSFIAALHRQPKMSANEVLDALAEELRTFAEDLNRHGREPSAGADALRVTAAMLESTSPHREL